VTWCQSSASKTWNQHIIIGFKTLFSFVLPHLIWHLLLQTRTEQISTVKCAQTGILSLMDCIANRVISNTNKLHQSYDIIHYTDTLWLSSHSQRDCNKYRHFVGAICLQSLTKCVLTTSPKVKIHRDKTRMLLQNSHLITIKTFLLTYANRRQMPILGNM
jgi:hypothetical protein